MDADNTPVPDPSGALSSPPRNPPTALATATPQPPRAPWSFRHALQSDPRTRRLVDNTIELIFDRADALGDEIARLFGVRRGTSTSTAVVKSEPPAPPPTA
jgi:hypothetical protein